MAAASVSSIGPSFAAPRLFPSAMSRGFIRVSEITGIENRPAMPALIQPWLHPHRNDTRYAPDANSARAMIGITGAMRAIVPAASRACPTRDERRRRDKLKCRMDDVATAVTTARKCTYFATG